MVDPKTFHKFEDEAVRIRAVEEAQGRLRTSLFVGMVGPILVGIAHLFDKLGSTPWGWMQFVAYASAPLGFLLMLINWIRVPEFGKFNKQTVTLVFITILACASTVPLILMFWPGSGS